MQPAALHAAGHPDPLQCPELRHYHNSNHSLHSDRPNQAVQCSLGTGNDIILIGLELPLCRWCPCGNPVETILIQSSSVILALDAREIMRAKGEPLTKLSFRCHRGIEFRNKMKQKLLRAR